MTLDRLEITPFPLIVGDVVQSRRSGVLTILKGTSRKVLYWSQGELVMAVSDQPDESLADFLVRKRVLNIDQARSLSQGSAVEVVSRFHESGVLPLSGRQTLLREWLTSIFIPLFSLDEGTAAFTDDLALDASLRVFIQSTAALVLEGIRSITNGLVLRRGLGDLKREIEPDPESRFSMQSMALTDQDLRIASLLTGPQSIEAFLKQFSSDSLAAARVVIGLLALGVFRTVDVSRPAAGEDNFAEMQRDLELLAAIGSSDERSLRALVFSRQMASLDHYQVLDIPRAATRAQILSSAEHAKQRYDPASYPPVLKDHIQAIHRRIDQAVTILENSGKRSAYDSLLTQPGGGSSGENAMQQRVTQRSIALQNYQRARQLSAQSDYYGAIVLLKQAVAFAPDMADAWFLLASCQERNPKWRRDAVENFQRALSADPNHIESLISLGDLYRNEGLLSRAQTCYEDALQIAPGNPQALSRLAALKKK